MGGWAWRLCKAALGDYIVTFQSFTFDYLGTTIIPLRSFRPHSAYIYKTSRSYCFGIIIEPQSTPSPCRFKTGPNTRSDRSIRRYVHCSGGFGRLARLEEFSLLRLLHYTL